jgi:hypothetical protein
MEEQDVTTENVKFALGVAIEWGSYAGSGAPVRIESLVSEGRLREAFELVETEAGPRPTADMYWLHMRDAAEGWASTSGLCSTGNATKRPTLRTRTS